MPKFHVYAAVHGTKYLGEFDAKDRKEAIAMGESSGAAQITLCHHCSSECEDPEIGNIKEMS